MVKIQLYIIKSKLVDHTSTLLSAGGVRKYDYEIGRFTSVDPLWEKYTGWTGYQYSLNNPVNIVDRDGRDVLVAFSGANFSGGQDNSTAGKIVSNLTNYAKENNISDFNAKAFSTQAYPTDFKIENAMQFINENLKDGEKLIIYGYSAGGVAAQSLSKALNEKDIKVDLLITVDAAFAWGSSSINREIPGNVLMNLNFFNTTPSFLSRSVGGKNITNSKNTIIKNIKKDSSHSNIDEETQKQVENEIKATVND
ncbi:MAG TPA: RHS repeat-associated core domain-containing protein [Candidatus Kapabacteria bacterium]|nr:RHS repeat-associated core domain-containing protein [Candidatus Kapabacteria bacterium]